MTKEELHAKLTESGYCATDEIEYAVLTAMATDRPLLIEGAPGVGKTSLAKAVASALGLPFLRIQMYDGLTDDRILYDINYQKQLLTLEAVRPILARETEGMTANEAIRYAAGSLDFYGREFLIERPVLKAIDGTGRKVLLLDEMDKAPEEIEYMLYEFLEEFAISIPQYGEIRCPEDQHPIVFVTSNCYRDLSEAFKRRCNYLYINAKSEEEMAQILLTRANVDRKLAECIARCLTEARTSNLRHTPSISEGIEWAKLLGSAREVTEPVLMGSLGIIVKDGSDMKQMRWIVNRHSRELAER